MSFRMRLAAYGALVVGAAMLGFGLLLNFLASEGAPDDQDKTLSAIVDELAAGIEDVPLAVFTSSAPLFPVDLGTNTDPYLAIYEVTGVAIYSTGAIDNSPPTLPPGLITDTLTTGAAIATAAPDGIDLRIHARAAVAAGGEDIIVVVGQPARFVDDQLTGLKVVIWAAAIITLIAGTIVAWLVSGRALRPLRQLAGTTDEIATTGDLSRRLPPVRSKDEVGALTASFNAMLDRLQSSQTQLAEALERQRRFVADASHELRSPLTTIRANAGFLQSRDDAEPDDRNEAVADIAAEADRMSRLVEDLLSLAKSDAGTQRSHEPVDLAEIVREVMRRSDHLATSIYVDATPGSMVEGVPDELHRLVTILVENAARHGLGPVRMSVSPNGSSAVVTVDDDGPGFPDDELDRVFERFYQGDSARSVDGAGLGLAIASEIVAAHGGSIDAANRTEGGARVTVRLPSP